jgi:predicted metal-binding protein
MAPPKLHNCPPKDTNDSEVSEILAKYLKRMVIKMNIQKMIIE